MRYLRAVELRQLRYFLAVAEELQFTRAAARLHIAAPSLSQQIRVLERDLNVRLFERAHRQVQLTLAGAALVPRARVILAETERAREDVRMARVDRQDQLSLRVATMAEIPMEQLLREMAVGLSGIAVTVASCPGDDVIDAVRQARADLGVVWGLIEDGAGLESRLLVHVPFSIAVREHGPLAEPARVPVSLLAEETLVLFPRAPFSGVWDQLLRHLIPAGVFGRQVIVETDLLRLPEAMCRAVAQGIGVAPLPAGIVVGLGVPGVVERALDPQLSLELVTVWREPAAQPLRRLIDFVTDPRRFRDAT